MELFAKRNFECDCGTSRLPATSPCTLRADEKTGVKGAVHSETPAPDNRYNQNFRSRFCGCGEVYDPHQEKGTMFQCLGLGTTETGGCGEDWWHPECLVGLPRNWDSAQQSETAGKEATDGAESKPEDNATGLLDEPPLPPGFPGEDDFETFVCYKCLESNPWLKRYAGSAGFLSPVYNRESPAYQGVDDGSKKRKFEDAPDDDEPEAKRTKEEEEEDSAEQLPAVSKEESNGAAPAQRHDTLPAQGPPGVFSLFLKEDFREHLCRCPDCFSNLAPHIQLREEEEVYEPPLSEAGDGDEDAAATGSQRSGSLLERGEAALSNVDRVRAIEGVMVYNHLKDKVKEFLKPYAESGEAVSADAIKGYFEKLRGDDQANEGEQSAAGGGEDGEGDSRREQSGMFGHFYFSTNLYHFFQLLIVFTGY